MDDSNAIIPTDPQRQFEKMSEFDRVSRKLLESELHNKRLRSLVSRICNWIADTREQEKGYLAEATVLLNQEPPAPTDTPTETTVTSEPAPE